MNKITEELLLKNKFKKSVNNEFYLQFDDYAIEIIITGYGVFPAIVKLPEFSSQYEQKIGIAAIETMEEIEAIIKMVSGDIFKFIKE
jgi:hypothetical protein